MVRKEKKKRRTQKRAKKPIPSRFVPVETCAQENSQLFQLPQEIRDHIYSLVFNTWYGHKGNLYVSLGENRGPKDVRDWRNKDALALLRTCRRVKEEVGDSWMKHAQLFVFTEPGKMLDALAGMSPDQLSVIREIRVSSRPIMLSEGRHYNENDGNTLLMHADVFYRLAAILKLLPGLCLDKLTVVDDLDCPNEKLLYDTLNGLIEESEGWQELHFIAMKGKMLTYAPEPGIEFPDRLKRRPQPMHWQSTLEQRDGLESKPSVSIFESTKQIRLATVTNPAWREQVEQRLLEGQTKETFGLQQDTQLAPEGGNEILIVAKRGAGVDYRVKENSPYLKKWPDIRHKWPGKTWKEIRRACIREQFHDAESDSDDEFGDFFFVSDDDRRYGDREYRVHHKDGEYEWDCDDEYALDYDDDSAYSYHYRRDMF
ncbi:hypothetical protein CONLIGDRAFT_632240 [Coniochaeta ligniaria NRRL 30616]|uniref:Uncharacterized protein n=1 Tax=Coniochaeta ligniaria NRRL 30616 TaxID=1408157 RepID=A0A1J7ISJ7_9PEZI|nr:hypothetical protein CONLIGDRAFT_632240 [Coniochaeta ligniaria NRRL 30616]